MFKCPLAPTCTQEWKFPGDTANDAIQLMVNVHMEEHNWKDYLGIIQGLLKKVQELQEANAHKMELINHVGQIYSAIQTVGGRVALLQRQQSGE